MSTVFAGFVAAFAALWERLVGLFWAQRRLVALVTLAMLAWLLWPRR